MSLSTTIPVIISFWMSGLAPRWAVRRLTAALGGDEDASVAAYEALVRIGRQGVDELLKEARSGHSTVAVLQILGDVGDPSLIPSLQAFADSGDPRVVAMAQESIESITKRHYGP